MHMQLTIILLSMGLFTACVKPSPDQSADGSTPPGPPGLVVTTSSGVRFEGPAMTIALAEGAHAQGAISTSVPGMDNARWDWNANVELEPSEIREASVQLAVNAVSAESPVREAGTGTVTMIQSDDEVIADGDMVLLARSGTLNYTLHSNGTVDGQASIDDVQMLSAGEPAPDELSASFSGKFGVTCWVYPETLGHSPNGFGDGETRIEDTAFTSSFCQPYKDLLHR